MSDSSSSRDSNDPENGEAIPFGAKFTQSEKFMTIFREGMALVEDTAAYLDGDGRTDSKDLLPPVSLAYATESMRLTTRLMQMASWLLIRRAVNEGELTPEEAREQEHKVRLKPYAEELSTPGRDQLPERLKELMHATARLHERIVKLDDLIRSERAGVVEKPPHPLNDHLARLQAAFPGDKSD